MVPSFGAKCDKENCRPSSVHVCHMRQPGCQVEECKIKQRKKKICKPSHNICKRDKSAAPFCKQKPIRKCTPCPQRKTCIPTMEQKCHREMKPYCALKPRQECVPKCNSVFVCPVCKNAASERKPKKFHPSSQHPTIDAFEEISLKPETSSHKHEPHIRKDIAMTLEKLRKITHPIPTYSHAAKSPPHQQESKSNLPTYSKGGW